MLKDAFNQMINCCVIINNKLCCFCNISELNVSNAVVVANCLDQQTLDLLDI